MKPCPRCGNIHGSDETLCYSCGAVIHPEKGIVACENHPGEAAIACCSLCGKPVCGDCTTSVESLQVCDLAEHHDDVKEWKAVALVENRFEAEMIAANLAQSGVSTRTVDPSVFIGCLGTHISFKAKVLVRVSALESAKKLLNSLHLINPES